MPDRRLTETVPFTPPYDSLSSKLANQLATGEIDAGMCNQLVEKFFQPHNPIGEVVDKFFEEYGEEMGTQILHSRMQSFTKMILDCYKKQREQS